MDEALTPQFVAQANVIVRIIPDPMSERDEFGNKGKLYALAATKLLPDDVNSPIAKYDVSYPTTSMLHILETQLRHLLHDVLGEASALPSAAQDGNISTVDWQAVAEELLENIQDQNGLFTCEACPIVDDCHKGLDTATCLQYIRERLAKKHTKEAHA